MARVWLASDHHFGHKNIIEYSVRPFNNLDEMHKTMIQKHNNVVAKADKVFFLGDVGFGSKEFLKGIVEKLNGNLTLIIGNHDRQRSVYGWYEVGFKEVIKYPIIYRENVVLSHHPLSNLPSGYINIHGHLHQHSVGKDGYINVSVEQIDYTPINILRLI